MNDDFYVYLLLDPRKDNEPFYVGKGKNLRYLAHMTPWEMKRGGNNLKKAVIAKILEEGLRPTVEFPAKGLTEDAAIELEKKLIAQYGGVVIWVSVL